MPKQALATLACLSLSLALHAAALGQYAQPVERHTAANHQYDFIIIGGGVAGLTVADRLTENPNANVLVIERGPFDKHEPEVLVPGLLNLTSTPYWYNLTSSPQPGLDNRSFQVPAAKVVGGGSVINGIFFDRGSASDYDAWAELGNPGWGWNDLLPYFRKSENFTPANADYAAEFDISWDDSVHGFGGPVQSSYPVYQYPGVKNFLDAWEELGVSRPKDPGAGTAYGAFWAPSSLDPNGETRSYARTAHYDRVIAQRPRYHVLTDTAVVRIRFDNKCASGVEVVDANNTTPSLIIRASREVILAAGVHSAQILQLSGIGETTLLNRYDIEVVQDLPGVGQNFQDHPTLYPVFNFQTDLHPNADDLSTNATYAAEQLALYWQKRQGAYTIVNQGGNVVAFLPLFNLSNEYSSIVAEVQDNADGCNGGIIAVCNGYQVQRSVIARLYQSTEASVVEYGFSSSSAIPITLVKPLSRGSLSIVSENIFDSPIVNFNTFSQTSDVRVLAEGLKKLRELLQTSAFQELSPVEISPGSNITTDADIESALKMLAQPTYSHPCCAAPMMPQEFGGVVDSELRVYGIKGLRIVDASIFPLIPATHTSATVYAVAEKAADIIKAAHRYSFS